MYGLSALKAINANAAILAEDRARQSKGLKPKSPAAAIQRKSRSATSRIK